MVKLEKIYDKYEQCSIVFITMRNIFNCLYFKVLGECYMKVLSYNIYGVVDTKDHIPKWNVRQDNLKKILHACLEDNDIKICCFQEVNQNNIKQLEKILTNHNFDILKKFPMKTQGDEQYNIVAIKKCMKMNLKGIHCLPHGKDQIYQSINEQTIDYGMSDYRTTIFVHVDYENREYLIGNIHTDYISTDGKIKCVVKSLNYMDGISADYKMVVGDMNMVSHMSEVYNIVKQNNNYITLSRSKNFDMSDYSWHGYGYKEPVNVDFAFIEKNMISHYDYEIIKQHDITDEGSDHRPIIISIH